MVIAMSVCAFISTALVAWALLPNESLRRIRQRIYSDVAGGVERQTPIAKVAKILAPINRRLPLRLYTVGMTRLLEHAGLHLPAFHFLAIQEMGALTGLLAYFVTMGAKEVNIVWLVGFVIAGFFIPVLWLRNRIQGRRMTVSRDLPEVVDLLTLSVGAGSDFMSALGRIVREFRTCPVRDELGIVLQEVRIGKRRRDALRAFAIRLQTPESATFARTLIQVDRMGTGMVEALSILSEDMRLQRYHWAERFAQQAPMKMLIPLIMSLGSAMIIVAGPILIQFLRGGFTPQMSAQEAMGEDTTESR